MPTRAPRFCRHAGCGAFCTDGTGYCPAHRGEWEEQQLRKQHGCDERRGSAASRGYGRRWASYSRAFLSRPENKFCVLHLDEGCAVIAQCVDHIDPPDSARDPRFWDKSNHQPACIHCNSVKGHRFMRGTFVFGEVL